MTVVEPPPAGGAVVDPEAELNEILFRLDRLGRKWPSRPDGIVEDRLFTLEQISRRVAYLQAQVLNAAESERAWALNGARSIVTWFSHATGATRAASSRAVKTARALREHLPQAARALGAGRIGVEHAQAMARATTRTAKLVEQLEHEEVGEGFLVDSAATMGAGEFAKFAKHWAAMADPEAADKNWKAPSEKEELFLSASTDHYFVSGQLNMVSGKLLEEALNAQMGRKGKGDDRPPAQRRAAALVELAQGWLDSGSLLPGARIRPHLTVTVPFPTLHALCEATGSAIPPRGGVMPGVSAEQTLFAVGGPRERDGASFTGARATQNGVDPAQWVEGWATESGHVISTAIDFAKLVGVEPATLEDGTVIPPSVLARLACDSSLMRVVFGPESTVLDAGRSKRIFPPNQTRAIIARDRHCQFPDCAEPPEHGEIHHSLWWWRHGGRTSVEQGILLCWWHHGFVHEHSITIMRKRGRWIFTDERGYIIRAASERGSSVLDRGLAGEESAGVQSTGGESAGAASLVPGDSTSPPGESDPPPRESNPPPRESDSPPGESDSNWAREGTGTQQTAASACEPGCYHPSQEEIDYYQIPRPEDDPWGRDIHELWREYGPQPIAPEPDWDPWDPWGEGVGDGQGAGAT